MKKNFFLLLFLGMSLSGIAQEKYFHDLRGMEDSTGITQLFYRMYENIPYQCQPDDDEDIIYTRYNHVYHLNTLSLSDSVKFVDYFEPWCLGGEYSSAGVSDYDFYDNDPSKWIIQPIDGDCLPSTISDYLGRKLELPAVCYAIKQIVDEISEFQNYNGFLLSNKEDSLYSHNIDEVRAFRVGIGDNDFIPNLEIFDEEDYGFYITYLNSTEMEYGLGAIHPSIDSLFYTKSNSGHLLISERYSASFSLVDSSAAYYKLTFDSDSSILYAIVTIKEDDKYTRFLKKSDNFGKNDSWQFLEIPETVSELELLTTDSEKNGFLYIADSTNIYESSDFGESFKQILKAETRVTGLYKKPDSSILYILTTNELLELNTETLKTTTLKTVPVSNEPDPELPASVQLHQNYPNPFNPSTNIIFYLNKDSEVRLSVFNLIGQELQVLIEDELRTEGYYSIAFNADGFASGIYLYQFIVYETGEVLTKKMTLIK